MTSGSEPYWTAPCVSLMTLGIWFTRRSRSVPCVRTTPNRSESRPVTRPSRMPRGEAETGGIAITILLALSEKFQEGD